ncbi:MAG: TolC family protein [Bacteroidales bacterium]|nr:TolC family protein [Bacteroidales bacterium]
MKLFNKTLIIKVLVVLIFGLQTVQSQTDSCTKLTLNELFSLADENSVQLKLSKSIIETSQTATEMIQANRLPSLDFSLSVAAIGNGLIVDRDFSHAQNVDMPHFGNNFGFEASQLIFAGGALSTQINKARLEEQIAQLNYDKNRMDVYFLLTGYYLELYKLRNQREVFLKNIEQTEILIRQIQAKQEQGMALENDVTRHELRLQNLQLSLIEINNNLNIINFQLVTTLGLPKGTIIEPDPSILDSEVSITSESDLYAIAEANLPELKTAEMKVQKAEKEIQLAQSDYYPSIFAFAANKFDGPILIEVPVINKNFNYYYAGIGIKYSLSSLYKSNQKVRLAKKQQQLAENERSLVAEHTAISVQRAHVQFKESFEKLVTYQKSYQLAAENYRIINNRYLNDLVLITEMLDAGNQKLNSELLVINAKINIIYNYYKLQREIGKLN